MLSEYYYRARQAHVLYSVDVHNERNILLCCAGRRAVGNLGFTIGLRFECVFGFYEPASSC